MNFRLAISLILVHVRMIILRFLFLVDQHVEVQVVAGHLEHRLGLVKLEVPILLHIRKVLDL